MAWQALALGAWVWSQGGPQALAHTAAQAPTPALQQVAHAPQAAPQAFQLAGRSTRSPRPRPRRRFLPGDDSGPNPAGKAGVMLLLGFLAFLGLAYALWARLKKGQLPGFRR